MLTTLIEPTVRDRAGRRASTWCASVARSGAASATSARATPPATRQRGRDELVSQGRAFGLSRAAAYARAEELLDAFDLTEQAMRPVSTLSGGQRRRLDVAIGLVHTPRLLFLDEPSTGLDPQNRANLQEQIAPPPRRAGHHDRAHHPLPRGGRRDRRPGGRHRPRAGDRRRHREPAEVRTRRPGDARLRRRGGGGAGRRGRLVGAGRQRVGRTDRNDGPDPGRGSGRTGSPGSSPTSRLPAHPSAASRSRARRSTTCSSS